MGSKGLNFCVNVKEIVIQEPGIQLRWIFHRT